MIPSTLAAEVGGALQDFLATGFGPSNPALSSVVDDFLAETENLLKGPYLSVELPFQRAPEGGEPFPETPLGFVPYRHQRTAFERLAGGQATVIATGTGSGKTECFLYPVLDHYRERSGTPGAKAIFIYPMNALASDQARRIAGIINHTEALRGKVTAGLYVGETGASPRTHMTVGHLIENREVLRERPPDILLTNYKMLDLLLTRPVDFPLWRHNASGMLRYLVVDELRTFDGAQGTDLACLIRRLRARLEAADIEHNLQAICTPEEMERIEVANLDRWVQRLLRGKGYRFRLVFERHVDAWREAMAKKPVGLGLPDRFFSHEWEQVIQANGLESREEYLRVARTGRGVRLNRAARAEIWRVFEEYRAQLAGRGVMEAADCYRAAAALLERERSDAGTEPASRSGNFASVIVDEAQDMVAPAWRLIRGIVPVGPNDLFVVGDAHQRIYSRNRIVLGRCGIDIRGRARKLRLNYRTTEETRRWASGLLERRSIDDLDGGSDDNRGVLSIAHGPEPRTRNFRTRDEQSAWLVRYLEDLLSQDDSLRGICIVTRTRYERDAVGEELMEAELPLELLETESPDDAAGGVRLATMHRVKGLEFDRMVIASTNESLVPLAATIPDGDDPDRTAAETAERALLYVAATRAKKDLTVLSFGTPSPFLN